MKSMSDSSTMKYQPIVSIIITGYNYAGFIGQAIRSALDQTYQAVEVIVVNDGSTDGTGQVVNKFREHIEYIEQPNSGVVIARNNGAKHATGEFILFLDADDYLPPEFVEVAIDWLLRYHADFVYTDRKVVGVDQFLYTSHTFDPSLLLFSNYVGLTSLIRKSVFERVGGFREELNRTKSYEDWDLWLSLVQQGSVGLYCPQTYYYHRKLYQGSRNDAGVFTKLRLRWPIFKLHTAQYLSFSTIVGMPRVLWLAVSNKRNFLLDRQGGG